jgi:uncharacterized protein (DUF433 family)
VLLPIANIMEDVGREVEFLKKRDPSQIGEIEKHRYVPHYATVIADTRIRVATILRFVESGYSNADILKAYPSLTDADIEAAKRHGAGLAA